MSIFVDQATASVLGIPELLARLRPDSPLGQRLVDAMPVYRSVDRTAWHAEMAHLHAVESWWGADEARSKVVRGDLAQLPSLDRPLRKLRARSTLDNADLFELKRFLYYGGRILDAASQVFEADPGKMQRQQLHDVMATIHPEATPSPRFHLASSLDPALEAVRRNQRRVQRAERARRAELESALVERLGGRFDLQGRFRPSAELAAHDLYAEPLIAHVDGQWRLIDEGLGELEDELADADAAVGRAEEQTRSVLSEDLRAHVTRLEEAAAHLGALDQRLARVRLRVELQGCWPDWSDQAEVILAGGREPRIVHALATSEDGAQPVDLRFDPARPVVITGPNMGGKSSLLELVGICLWCAQHAMPVPAKSLRFSPFEAIIYVGSEEPRALAASEGLSSFGREVRRLVDAWEGAAPRLWLLDELGRGTHPDEGAAIACEVISRRIEAGDAVVAATHFPAVAALSGASRFHIAGLRDRALLLSALGDVSSDLDAIRAALRSQMDYRPVPTTDTDVPRDARFVARALGLPIAANELDESS